MTIPSPASWATDMATLPMTKPCATDTDAPEVRRVLFVCTGNTCRSPMAAALLNHLSRPREVCSACGERGEAPRYAASSAGLYAMAGDPITPHAAAALAAFGVPSLPSNDYTAHRARPVTEALLEAADVVVGISGAHAMELMMRYPHQASKITTFESDVPDPFGGSEEVYRQCLMQLSHLIRALLFGGEGEA